MNKKFLRRLLATSLTVSALTFTAEIYFPPIVSVVHAEVKEYVGVGESIVSDRETIDIGKQGAKLQAIRNAQEKAGMFISSYSVMKDQELETDEVIAFTAGIVKINDNIKYEPIPLGDDLGTIKYRATVIVTIDTDDLTAKINQWLGKTSQDRSTLTERSRDLNNTLERIQTRTTEIETAVAGASSPVDATKIQAEIKELDKDILYAQKISEGNEFMRKGDRDSAMRLYQEAIALYPKDATIAYEKLGDSYRDAKDYARAIDAYTKVIQMDPNYVAPYRKRGDIYYFHLNDYKKAAADFEKVLAIAPKSTEIRKTCIGLYFSLGEYEKAALLDKNSATLAEVAKYDKLIKAGNATADNYFMRAKAFGSSYINLAFADINKAIELDPNNSEYFYRRYFFYTVKKDYDGALADLSKAIELDPNNKTYLKVRACFYFALKDYNLAAKDFERCTKLQTREDYLKNSYAAEEYLRESYDFFVRCYEILGDKAKAIEACMAASKDKNLSKFRRDQFKDIAKRIQKSK